MDVVKFMDDLTGHNVLAWKAALGTFIVLLAGLQVALAGRFWNNRGLPVDSALATVLHRWNGRLLLVLSLVIGYACLMGPAGPTSPFRLLFHSILGATLFALIFAKLLTLRVINSSGNRLPIIGIALFVNYVLIWFVTVADYVTDASIDPPPGAPLKGWAAVTGAGAAILGGIGIAAFVRRSATGTPAKKRAKTAA